MIKTLKVGDKLITNNDGSWYDYPTDAVVDGKTGYLFPPGDVNGLTQSLLRLITDAVVDGPEYNAIVTVRAIGVDFEHGTWRPTVWLEEFPGDTYDDSFYLSNFDIIDE